MLSSGHNKYADSHYSLHVGYYDDLNVVVRSTQSIKEGTEALEKDGDVRGPGEKF